MLKFFEQAKECHIILETPLIDDDREMLKSLFARVYDAWYLEFGRVYTLSREMINTLYYFLSVKDLNIKITTHNRRLTRYLKRLGFQAKFDSLITRDVVSLSKVEVILVGGSADSSTKIVEMVKNIEAKNISFVIVQHVKAGRIGEFDKVLQRETSYPVMYARDAQKIVAGAIYIAPNEHHLLVEDGYFCLDNSQKYNYAKPSISLSYESFSAYYKEKLLVIQECGYVDDGVDKMQFLKKNGSKLIIQKAEECEAQPMITNAMALHVEDYIFPIKDIVLYLEIIATQRSKEVWIEFLLDEIVKRYSYDFRLYHRDMVSRRVDIFMLKHSIKDIKDAVGVILFNKDAFKAFFLEVSINVTEFFREPDSYQAIAKFLQKRYQHTHNIKLWSAGCSSGEEVYSLAIVLDILGFLDKSLIYATDFNDVVLEEAKNGLYANDAYPQAESNFSQVQLEAKLHQYLKKNSNYMQVDEKIREKVLFFRHNLVEDSSFNEFDIIICKNVIIYFDTDLQEKVFKLFCDSLKFGGHLVLGKSEMISEKFQDRFQECSKNSKIFKKVA